MTTFTVVHPPHLPECKPLIVFLFPLPSSPVLSASKVNDDCIPTDSTVELLQALARPKVLGAPLLARHTTHHQLKCDLIICDINTKYAVPIQRVNGIYSFIVCKVDLNPRAKFPPPPLLQTRLKSVSDHRVSPKYIPERQRCQGFSGCWSCFQQGQLNMNGAAWGE